MTDRNRTIPLEVFEDSDTILGPEGADGWGGLHGPVEFLGCLLFTDDPELMKYYWMYFCGERRLAALTARFPELSMADARRVCEGDLDGFVFVHINGHLQGWHMMEDKSPSIRLLRDALGKQASIWWMEAGEAEARAAAG